MNDIGYEETERELARLEAELHEAYQTAAAELQEKANDYFSYFAEGQKHQQELLDAGKIDHAEYTRWCTTHMLTGQRWQNAANTLAAELLQTNQMACAIINGTMPQVYALNSNWQTYVIEHETGIDTGFTLYSRDAVIRIVRDSPSLLPNMPSKIAMRIMADMRWNRKNINSCVLQGILQGDTSTELAGRLRMVSDMNERVSIRNARTMTTSAQNGGRLDSMLRAKRMGIDMKQMWIATLDNRTRHSHRQVDGEQCEVGETFSNGCRFPGDPDGKPHEVYNCRCSLVSVDPLFEGDASDLSQRDTSHMMEESYEEWKNAKSNSRNYSINPDNPSYGYAVDMSTPASHSSGGYQSESIPLKNGLTSSAGSSTIKAITVDDFELLAYGSGIHQEVQDALFREIQLCEKNGRLVISDVKIGKLTDIGGGTSAIQTEMLSNGLLRLNINTEVFAGASLDEIDARFAQTDSILAQNLHEAMVHEMGHAKTVKGLSPSAVEKMYRELAKVHIDGVSEYAYSDGAECIAEVEILINRGETVPEDAMELYRKYVLRRE